MNAALLAVFLFAPAFASPANAPTKGDVVTLLEEGKIGAALTARGAYRLEVALKNRTKAPLEVEFPPGLVADTYARFNLFQVGGGGGGVGGGSGGGGQSMGLLQLLSATVEPDQTVTVAMRTACLNYGVPEPTPRTVLFLKRAEEFTTNPIFPPLLRSIASSDLSTEVAQAALWRITDGLSWDRMAEMTLLGQARTFTREQLRESQRLLAEAESAAREAAATESTDDRAGRRKLAPPVTVMIHPDPRGTKDGPELVRAATRVLRRRFPDFAFSHANGLLEPADRDAPATAWCVFVQPKGAKAESAGLVAQRSVWDPKRRAWKRESPLPAPAMKRTGGADEQDAWLATFVMREIAARSIKIDAKPAGEGAKVTLRNDLPVPLDRLRLSDRTNASLDILLEAVSLPAGGKATAEISAPEAARLLAAKKPIVTSFQAASQTR